jgi:hypothetical protein
VIAHCACEIESVEWRRLLIWKVLELVVQGTLSSETGWKDARILQSVPAEKGRKDEVCALIHVQDCLSCSHVSNLWVYLLFAHAVIVPVIECIGVNFLKRPED